MSKKNTMVDVLDFTEAQISETTVKTHINNLSGTSFNDEGATLQGTVNTLKGTKDFAILLSDMDHEWVDDFTRLDIDIDSGGSELVIKIVQYDDPVYRRLYNLKPHEGAMPGTIEFKDMAVVLFELSARRPKGDKKSVHLSSRHTMHDLVGYQCGVCNRVFISEKLADKHARETGQHSGYHVSPYKIVWEPEEGVDVCAAKKTRAVTL